MLINLFPFLHSQLPPLVPGYSFYRSITIDSTNIGSTLTDFPILVAGTFTYLRTVANGGKVQNASGFDIAFYDGDGVQLSHETERWIDTSGEVVYWVKVPSISHITDTIIYMVYGNSSISVDQSNKADVWSNGFICVYHLPDGTTLSATDSLGTYDGTITGVSAASGKYGGGGSWAGGASTNRITRSSVPASGTIRVRSAWIYLDSVDSTTRRLYELGGTNFRDATQISTAGIDIGIQWTNVPLFSTTTVPATGTWHHFMVTYDGTSTANYPAMYYNGVAQTVTRNLTPSGTLATTTQSLYMGNRPDNARCFSGDIDEFRVANVMRSADWAYAEYVNQDNPANFYTISDEVAQ
jgi:hypothetical protein